MDIPKLLDAVKLEPRIWFAILVALSLLLFPPAAMESALGYGSVVDQYRPWLGLGWVIAAGFLLSHILVPFVVWAKDRFIWRFIRLKAMRETLTRLTPDEQAFLARYLLRDTKTLYASLESGLVAGLEATGIIGRASGFASGDLSFPFNIQPWAWSHLHNHPELVGLKSEDIAREAERQPTRRA